MAEFVKKLQDDQVSPHLGGLFPKNSVENARFATNFYTSIGLGPLTEDLREFIKEAPKKLLEQKYAQLLLEAEAAELSSSSSDSDSSSGSSSGSSSRSSSPSRK